MDPEFFTADDCPTLTLRDLTSPLLRQKRAFFGIFVLAFAVVTGLALPQWHRSNSPVAMLVSPQRPPSSDQAVRQERAPAQPARPARSPSSIFILAFVLAVLVSVPTAHVLDYFDPFFHTPAEVIKLLGIPVVVELPK